MQLLPVGVKKTHPNSAMFSPLKAASGRKVVHGLPKRRLETAAWLKMVGCLAQRSRCSLMIGGIILSNSFGIIMFNHPYMFNHQNYWIYIYIQYIPLLFFIISCPYILSICIYIWLIIQELGSNQVFIWMMEFEDLKIEKIISWTLQVSRWKRFGFPNGWMPCLSGWFMMGSNWNDPNISLIYFRFVNYHNLLIFGGLHKWRYPNMDGS